MKVKSGQSFDLGIRSGRLLSMKNGEGQILEDYFIGVQGDTITEVSAYQNSFASECKKFIDASSKIMIPGLINGHTHLAMSLFRGFEDDLPFEEWLRKRIFPIESAVVDENFVRIGTSLGAMESIRFGTTTVSDHYYFPHTMADVIDKAGMRGLVAQTFMDGAMPDDRHPEKRSLAERVQSFKPFYEKYKNHPRIQPTLGPHSPYADSDELIRLIAQIAKELSVPVHMHVCETMREVNESLARYQKTPFIRLNELGILNDKFIAAHGVHLSDEEIDLCFHQGVSIIYNPDSNLKLSSGIAPIAQYLKKGIKLGIGSDGAASNNDLSLFGAMDLGTKLQKLSNQDTTAMVALDALNLATYEGARALGLGSKIGSIEVGKKADLVLLGTHHPHVQPLYSVLSQLVYAYQGLEVETVICDGKMLFDQGQYLTLNEKQVLAEVEQMRLKIQHQLTQLQSVQT